MNTQESLKSILDLNSISVEDLCSMLYIDIVESVVGQICSYMKNNSGHELEIRKAYNRSADDHATTEQIIKNICGIVLPQKDILTVEQCLKARLRKRDYRKRILPETKENIWIKQKRKCACCGRMLTLDEAVVDHRIPWDYVGDELDGNYQILCSICNWKKTNHVGLNVSDLFFKKEREAVG